MVKRIMAMRRMNTKMAKIDRWPQWVSRCPLRPAICERFKRTCKNGVIQLFLETRISGRFHTRKKIRMTIFKTKARVQPRGINVLHRIQQLTVAHNARSKVRATKSPSRALIPRKVRILNRTETKKCLILLMNFATQNSNLWLRKLQIGSSWKNYWLKFPWSMIFSTVSKSRTRSCFKVIAKFSLKH